MLSISAYDNLDYMAWRREDRILFQKVVALPRHEAASRRLPLGIRGEVCAARLVREQNPNLKEVREPRCTLVGS